MPGICRLRVPCSTLAWACCALLFAVASTCPVAADSRADAIAGLLQPYVDHQTLAGAVALVADRDRVLDVVTVGWADIAAKRPMQADCLFGIASMSKPMTAFALMMLVDEGKVSVEDPVEKYLPEFRGQMFIAEQDDLHVLLKRPQRPLRVRHVLSHTGGLLYKSPMEAPTFDALTLRDAVRAIAMLPLQFEPGTKYLYSSAGIAVAARIVEVVAEKPFEKFIAQQLFHPLGMVDTTFVPSADQASRVATLYRAKPDKSGLEAAHAARFSYPLDNSQRQPVPGSGLFSTAADVARFCQMILRRGEHDGKRLLWQPSFDAMISRQTPPELKSDYGFGWDRLKDNRIGHGGSFQTYMIVDYPRGLIYILLMHQDGPWLHAEGKQIWPRFQALVLQLYASK